MCGGDSASTNVRRTRCSPPCPRTAAASYARFQLHPESHRPRIPQQRARTLTQCHGPLRISQRRRLLASSLKPVCAARARVPSHRPRALRPGTKPSRAPAPSSSQPPAPAWTLACLPVAAQPRQLAHAPFAPALSPRARACRASPLPRLKRPCSNSR
ncbi:hypothetical protein FIBSPDRAFT_855696 [Athelia psychrophila]|uniref:Uncharacterized protein n=1 Tax=Athelia psychrophila TaxID=1759441 RepID=A0A166NYP3_9AGAM|nr:hypothetical protein FIBSPDRAFT_855696 [Fibularhizoctonia sp. CBS 109695]